MCFQWWGKANYSEQYKGEKAIAILGYKGTDKYQELKVSITSPNDKLQKLIEELRIKPIFVVLYNLLLIKTNITVAMFLMNQWMTLIINWQKEN